MSYQKPIIHKRAFQASFRTVFIYSDEVLVGFGRALSDGEYQAALYDICVTPQFQGHGIGRIIVSNLKDDLSNCNIIFYATPGMEGFYKKQGFYPLSTGMGLFRSSEANKKLTHQYPSIESK
jgi:ribosomal protein S18 acetylase RimI-like enzyme